MSLEAARDMIGGVGSMARARIGDLSLLVERLREGRRLTDQERHFLADLIEKKIKRPANNPPRFEIEIRNEQIVVAVLTDEKINKGQTPMKVWARHFGVGPRQIYRILEEAKGDRAHYAKLCRRAERNALDWRRAEEWSVKRRETVQQRWDERRSRRAQEATAEV
ncbi:MAG: hypothetical protein EBR82_20050 [Caulobacteraceae bacterium]|nr:hypothetical protein [Caulobacteraceae bacterium]